MLNENDIVGTSLYKLDNACSLM